YLFIVKPGPWISAAIVVVLSALTFVPFHVIHPVRIAHLRAVTTAALVVWAMLAILAIAQNLDPASWTVAALCLLALYFVVVGFLRRRLP
ncbi:MAG: phosphatidylcholine synthase, partial [Xanthobacteraceae bacterium]